MESPCSTTGAFGLPSFEHFQCFSHLLKVKQIQGNSSCWPESADVETQTYAERVQFTPCVSENLNPAFPFCVSSHVSCFLHRPGSVQQWQKGEGAEEVDSPSLLASLFPSPLPSLPPSHEAPRRCYFFCWCFSRDTHLSPSGLTPGPPTWGPLCFALIVMPQPVTLTGKGQAPRQSFGEISQLLHTLWHYHILKIQVKENEYNARL